MDPTRVLVLHGMHMSGTIMRELMADVLDAFADQDWQWTFVDAANKPTQPPFEDIRRRWPEGPYWEWWSVKTADDMVETVEYLGLERSLDLIRRALADQPYDLLMGFSQGCALATILTAMAERGELVPSDKRWRGVVLFNSGSPPRDPSVLPLFEDGPLETPSIHVLGGATDMLYERQKEMLGFWSTESRAVLEHEQGHITPTAAQSPDVMARLRAAVLKTVEPIRT